MQLRRTVGMVFQQFNLFPHMTALQNVMAGPIYALGKPHAEAEATAKKLLDRVGLGEKHRRQAGAAFRRAAAACCDRPGACG